jgi:myo-inositol 2-dehydrogenase / D-chiro-inositol 1-dehydrogenase
VGFPTVIPSSALGADGAVAPSNRIGIGMIGNGRQAYHANLPFFLSSPLAQVLAVCDVDSTRMNLTAEKVKSSYGEKSASGSYKGCFTTKDFREVLARKDIDAVMISTPDHWHVYMAIEAAKAGKDVALEKPITLSIEQGRLLSDAIKKYNRIFRVDSEVRYSKWFHQMCELARNGRLGKIKRVLAGTPKESPILKERPAPMPVPPELDYAMWQGPAPEAPYTEKRVHPKQIAGRPGWMQIQEYCQGMISNWGAHLIDIVQWGLDTEHTGPVAIEGKGTYPQDNFYNVLQGFEINYTYANGIELQYSMAGRPFVRFEGTEGWIEVEWFKSIKAEPKSLLDIKLGDNDLRLPFISEKEDFVQSVKSRKPTLADAEIGHRTTTVCQLGVIAIDTGRKLRWDPTAERFIGDDAANKMLSRPMREPWKIG